MTDRDRLIESILQGENEADKKGIANCQMYNLEKAKILADYLLANGVIAPPYKIGTKVYVITSQTSDNKNLYIFEDIISHYYIADNYVVMGFDNHLGVHSGNWDKVFLTKEEAEKALVERRDNNG